MLLHIIARGRIGTGPEAALVERYLTRLTLPHRVSELPDAGGREPPRPAHATRDVVLDEQGRDLSSEAFADVLGMWRGDGVREVRFWLGAADGHPAERKNGADLLLAYGRATWPHLLARAMLAEQLYRATTILAGHPYHRSGPAR